ncbi:hypothetical protein [Methylobacterium sp. CM6247]
MSKTLYVKIDFVKLHQKAPSDYSSKPGLFIEGQKIINKYSLEVGFGDPGEDRLNDTFDFSEFSIGGVTFTRPDDPYGSGTYQTESGPGTTTNSIYKLWWSVSVSDDYVIPSEYENVNLGHGWSGDGIGRKALLEGMFWNGSTITYADISVSAGDIRDFLKGDISKAYDQVGKWAADKIGLSDAYEAAKRVEMVRDALIKVQEDGFATIDTIMTWNMNSEEINALLENFMSGSQAEFDEAARNLLGGGVPREVVEIISGTSISQRYSVNQDGTYKESAIEIWSAGPGSYLGYYGSGFMTGQSNLPFDIVLDGAGNSTIMTRNPETFANVRDIIAGGGGDDQIISGSGGDIVNGGTGNDNIDGSDGDDIMYGGEGDDSLRGNSGDDTIYGGGGDDLIFTEIGADIVYGGTGNDFFIIQESSMRVYEYANEGVDTVESTVSFDASDQDIEKIVLLGTENLSVVGNSLNNRLTGNGGDNIISGMGGADVMYGGAGDDFFVVTEVGDIVKEFANQGLDKVYAHLSYALTLNVEDMVMNSGGGGWSATGNTLNNTITATRGNNIIDGKQGLDTLIGLSGNDIYIVDNAGDKVIELNGEGNDTIKTSTSYALNEGISIENIRTASESANININLSGNEISNKITGNAGKNILNGGEGGDFLSGKAGDDTYIISEMGDKVFETTGQGSDTVQAMRSYTLAAGQSIETLRTTAEAGTAAINLTGNELANKLVGNAGANILTGGGTADSLYGRGGADTFLFKALADSASAASGRDTIQDFVRSQGDRIDLHLIDAVAGGVVNQAFKFIGAAGFHDKAGELRSVSSGSNTLVSGDVDGNGVADFSILLKGALTLQAGDFIL